MAEIKAKAWTYKSFNGGMIPNLSLTDYKIPDTKADHVLIEVLNASVNPGDLKFPGLPIVKWLIKYPASPCWDFCGRIRALPANFPNNALNLQVGQVVWGMNRDIRNIGTLKTMMWVHKDSVYPLPEQAPTESGSAFGVGALTAYQAIKPHAQPGKKILINGGAGGVGTFCIQVAKALGMYTIATCSEAGAQLCKDLGADEILDYKSPTFADDLRRTPVDLVIDNVGNDIAFHRKSEAFLKPDGQFVLVALMDTAPGGIQSMIVSWLLPTFLGGPRRKWRHMLTSSTADDYRPIADLVRDGKLKVVVDSIVPFAEAPRAMERVKSGRAKGKVLVDMTSYHGGA